MTGADILPAPLLAMVEGYMAASGEDFGSPEAMTSECERHSRLLAAHIDAAPAPLDEWEDPIAIRTWTPHRWEAGVPEALGGDELALGHVVCRVTYEGETYEIDLTAAQFREAMGWTGPRVRAL